MTYGPYHMVPILGYSHILRTSKNNLLNHLQNDKSSCNRNISIQTKKETRKCLKSSSSTHHKVPFYMFSCYNIKVRPNTVNALKSAGSKCAIWKVRAIKFYFVSTNCDKSILKRKMELKDLIGIYFVEYTPLHQDGLQIIAYK